MPSTHEASRYRLLTGMICGILSLLSGLLLWKAFPPFENNVLTFFGLVPLFGALFFQKKPVIGFIVGFLCGVPFFLGIFSWVLTVGKYTLLHHGVLDIYLCCYFGMFGFLFVFIASKRGAQTALVCAPFMWVMLEYVRSNFFFLALPWGVLGYAHFNNPTLIQIASIFGTYGVSFLLVSINAALTIILLYLVQQAPFLKSKLERWGVSGRFTLVAVFLTVAMVGSAFIYGFIRLSRTLEGDTIKVAVVQGNIHQSKKWNKQYAREIMQIYADLTMTASHENPDLIVWPETATPWALNLDKRLRRRVENIAREAEAHLLLGSAQVQKFKLDDPKKAKYKNSAYLVSPDGKLYDQRYDKIHLLPFGEYLPYKNKIPWHYLNVPEIGSYIPGSEFVVFDAPFGRFSATICWENVFSDVFRPFVNKGAQFMVNITNEAWFGKTSAPYHFLSMSVLRAVENRVAVIRCANTGVSCFIDPCGRIVDRVKGQDGADLCVRGILTGRVGLSNGKTLYTRYGEFFPKFCAFVTLTFVLLSLFKRSPNSMQQQ